jgi:polyisoprenoid-binding protein YceI
MRIVLIALLSVLTFKSEATIAKFDTTKNLGAVRFFALGNPSAIRIEGTGSAPEGKLDVLADEKVSRIGGQFIFNLVSLNSGIELRDNHMKEKYLEVDKFPQSKLTIDTLVVETNILNDFSKSSIPFSGTLNLHGKDKVVSGVVDLKLTNKKELKILAKFKIKPTDFKIEIPSFAGITVADDVDVEVEIQSEKI